MTSRKKIRVARVVSSSMSYISLLPILKKLHEDNLFELYLISGDSEREKYLKSLFPRFVFHSINLKRNISLINDLKSLVKLSFFLIKNNIEIIHSHTPKAGLVSMIAGFLTWRKVRIHTYTGQVWVDYGGVKRKIFKSIDKLIFFLSSCCYVDGPSQKKFLIQNNIGNQFKLKVLGHGSLSGLDVERFIPKFSEKEKNIQKWELFQIKEEKILLFVGRINKDKGIWELLKAFSYLKEIYKVKLLLVGPLELLEGELYDLLNRMLEQGDVFHVNFTSTPELYYSIGDIFCLPTYREGCPVSILEASAMMIPVVSTNIYGVWDTLKDGETGLVCNVKNWTDLKDKLEILIKDEELAKELGKKGRNFVKENFNVSLIYQELIADYIALSQRS